MPSNFPCICSTGSLSLLIVRGRGGQRTRDRLVATYDHDVTAHEENTGYHWDIVLTGRDRTWMEPEDAQ